MKRYLSFITFCLLCCVLTFSSCTEDADDNGKSEPLSKTVEMILHAVKDESVDIGGRGVTTVPPDFDLIYDPNYIYLHIVGSEETVLIPITSTECLDKDKKRDCKCFRYYLETFEDGSAKVTPILADGSHASESLSIPAGSKLYFSSIEESVWELPANNIEARNKYNFFQRDNLYNKEVYRSAENFSIDDLDGGIDVLIIKRACAGFNLVGLFYDGVELKDTEEIFVDLEDWEFEEVMLSSYSTWYMKIYIGGETFSNKYDLGTMQSVGEYTSGYYSTGDFAPFSKRNFSYAVTLGGYGYYTKKGQQLFAPGLGKEVNVYILIKHWEGAGKPSADWLASDENALYTRMNITGGIDPVNNCFYILGLLMDINQFKIVWENANNSTAVMSRNANGMYYFPMEDAIVISERN